MRGPASASRPVLDTTDAKPMIRAGRRLPAALLRADLLLKGRRWIREVRATGTPVIRNVTDIQIEGDAAANRISYETADGRRAHLRGEHIFLHQGVVPNVNLSMSIGLAHRLERGASVLASGYRPWGASSVDGVFVAGDGAGIDGAVSAAAGGTLSALQVLTRLGRISPGERDRLARRPRGVRRREALSGRSLTPGSGPPTASASRRRRPPSCAGVKTSSRRDIGNNQDGLGRPQPTEEL